MFNGGHEPEMACRHHFFHFLLLISNSYNKKITFLVFCLSTSSNSLFNVLIQGAVLFSGERLNEWKQVRTGCELTRQSNGRDDRHGGDSTRALSFKKIDS